MRFSPSGRCFTFDVPDDWWSSSGMADFRPSSCCYPWRPIRPGFAIEILPLTSIRRGARNRVGGDFDRERMLAVLRGIASCEELPPVEVVALQDDGPFTHRLYDGFHRFSASIAAGFDAIPAIVVGEP